MPRSVVVGFLTAHVRFPCACPVSAGLCKSCSPYRLRCRPASYNDGSCSAADEGGRPAFMLMRRRHRTAFAFPGHQRFLPGASIELPPAVARHIDDRNERQGIQGQFGKSSRHCCSSFFGALLGGADGPRTRNRAMGGMARASGVSIPCTQCFAIVMPRRSNSS